MKFNLQKNLILEQMSANAMHAAWQGRTMTPEELHREAQRKTGTNIDDISDAQHKAQFAKNMYGMNPEQIEKERVHAASVRSIGL